MNPPAIETFYRGIQYRSRLEARYAVLFDLLDITAHYEHEGFKLASGRWYLPDFYLPRTGVWVEVKGSEDRLDRSMLLDTARQLSPKRPGAPVLMILGPLPRKGRMQIDGHAGWEIPCHAVLTPMRNTVRVGLAVMERGEGPCCCRTRPTLPGKKTEPTVWDLGETVARFEGWLEGGSLYTAGCSIADADVLHAYQHALSARFEHGESGAAPFRLTGGAA